MPALFTNNASGALASSITSASTTIVLSSGQGAEFPALAAGEFFYATLTDSSNNLEVIRVTARTSDTLTAVRAQDGTTARAYSAGALCELRVTAAALTNMVQKDGTQTITGNKTFSGTNVFSGANSFTGSASFSSTITGSVSGNAGSSTNATNVGITNDTSTNATMYPLWATANTGNLPAKVSSTKLTFNPATGVLSSTAFTATGAVTAASFSGAGTGLTGTASSLSIGGNAATVTNGVTTTGTQTLTGDKTFTGTITSTAYNYNAYNSSYYVANGTGGGIVLSTADSGTVSTAKISIGNAGAAAYDAIGVGLDLVPYTDNVKELGSATARWKEVFAGNGTINTSDEREKEQISDIPEAVFRAWAKVNFVQFKWKSAVQEKGDKARIHMGLIAQQVKFAFESEGLDAFAYGLLCYDEWEARDDLLSDKDGSVVIPGNTAGNRYGIRYEEALALECAYTRYRLNQLESK